MQSAFRVRGSPRASRLEKSFSEGTVLSQSRKRDRKLTQRQPHVARTTTLFASGFFLDYCRWKVGCSFVAPNIIMCERIPKFFIEMPAGLSPIPEKMSCHPRQIVRDQAKQSAGLTDERAVEAVN
jgi:hypothetical protein